MAGIKSDPGLWVAELWLMAGIKSDLEYNTFPYLPMGKFVSKYFSLSFHFVPCLTL